MEQMEILERISDLEREIAALPPGSVSAKKVRGKEYFYHRYTNNGKRIENYIVPADVDALRAQIEKRKTLEAELKDVKRLLPVTKRKAGRKKHEAYAFKTQVSPL